MPQKILIALDESEISSKVVEFAAKTVSKNSIITLFSVLPNVDLLCELDLRLIKGFHPKQYPDYCQAIQNEKRRLLNLSILILGSINAATAVIVFPYAGIPWPESILQDSDIMGISPDGPG